MIERKYQDPEWLKEKYKGEGLSTSEMGLLAECSDETIRGWMKKHNISRRTLSESNRGKQHKKFSAEACQRMSKVKRGERNPKWNGGYRRNKGYVYIWSPNHPYADCHSYMAEHRLIMEKHLGRFLESWEIIHHINGIRDDNRIENLELFPGKNRHNVVTLMVNARVRAVEIEAQKWEKSFYGAVGSWLGERRKRLE